MNHEAACVHALMIVCMVVVESQLAPLASIDVGSGYSSLPRQRPAAAEMIVTKSKKIFVSNDEGNMAMIGWGAALMAHLYVFALEYKESFQVVLGLIYYHCKVMQACHKLWHFLNSVLVHSNVLLSLQRNSTINCYHVTIHGAIWSHRKPTVLLQCTGLSLLDVLLEGNKISRMLSLRWSKIRMSGSKEYGEQQRWTGSCSFHCAGCIYCMSTTCI